MNPFFTNKRILVTGACGTIGQLQPGVDTQDTIGGELTTHRGMVF